MIKKYFGLIAWILIVAFPSATLMAESRGGMLYTNGDVSVNGKNVGRSVSLLKGDTVQTAKNSQVTLALNGSTVSLPANSGLRYTANDVINIGCGAAAIKTTNGLSSRAAGILIQPSSPEASYDVVSTGKTLKIAARNGALSLRDGFKSVTVPAGQMATLPGNCDLVAQNDSTGAAGPSPQGGVGSAASNGAKNASSTAGISTLNAVTFGLITLGVIGGAIGVGIAATRRDVSSSTR